MSNWSLLFATPLFAYVPPYFGPAGFYTPYLLVPFAALLARRFGASGVVSIALGGVAFVIYIGGRAWGGIGGSPALYLIALAVAAIAAMPRPILESLRWPDDDGAAWWLGFAAPFLLVLSIGIGGAPADGLSLSFGFAFSLLGYFLLFVLGVRGVRASALVLGFVAAAALGWGLAVNGLVMRSRTGPYLSIYALQPSTVLTALAMLSAGAAVRAFLSRRAPGGFWRRPYLAVTALVFLWFGPAPIASIPIGLESVHYLNVLQVPAALMLAGFMAGLLRGARGTIFVTVLAAGLILVWTLFAEIAEANDLHFYTGSVALEGPFVAAAYAVMGARAAEVRGEPAHFRMLRLPTLLVFLFLLALGATLAILGEGGPVRTTLAALFVLSVIAASVAAWRLQRAMAARGLGITSEKWAPFIAILGVVGTIVTNLQSVGEQLKQLFVLVLLPLSLFSARARAELRGYFGNEIDGEMLAFMLASAAVYLVLFIVTVRGLRRTVPKIYADLRKMAAFVRERRRGRAAPAA